MTPVGIIQEIGKKCKKTKVYSVFFTNQNYLFYAKMINVIHIFLIILIFFLSTQQNSDIVLSS